MSNFPCSGCNADLQFSPGQGELECPYCGSKTSIESAAEEGEAPAAVIEYDLESALRDAPVGWASEVVEFQCKNCSAFTAVEPHVTATSCAFCGTNQLEVQPTSEDMEAFNGSKGALLWAAGTTYSVGETVYRNGKINLING